MQSSFKLLIASAAFAMLSAQASASTYDLSSSFSTTSNSSGPFTFGYETTLGGTFTAYNSTTTVVGSTGQFVGWTDGQSNEPNVYKNLSMTTNNIGTVSEAAGQVSFHPGPNREFSVIRFTAPVSSLYAISGSAFGTDFVGPTDTEIYGALNQAAPIDLGAVRGYNAQTLTYNGSIFLTAGTTVDALVGYDPLGTRPTGPFSYDTTGVNLSFTSAVPEPSTWAMMVLGFCGIGFMMYRLRPQLGLFAA